jgi:hypothetical protein
MNKKEQVAKIAHALVRETAANISDYSDREEEFRQRFAALVTVHQEAQPERRIGETAHGVAPVQQVVTALCATVKKRDAKLFISLMQYLVDADAILLAIVNDLLTDLCAAQGWGGLSSHQRKALPLIEAVLFGSPS